MSYGLGFLIESLVAVLLMITILYCMVLNRRLKLFKADEGSLKATISELITATEIAQRAVAGLKTTAHECEQTLGERLRGAELCCASLDRHVKAGDAILNRLARVVGAARSTLGDTPVVASAPDPKALAAAAQALAERARERSLAA